MREWHKRTGANNPQEYNAETAKKQKRHRENNSDAHNKTNRRYMDTAVDEKRFYCAICDHAFTNVDKLNGHLASQKQVKRAAKAQSSSGSSS